MAQFKYTVLDAADRSETGIIEAVDSNAALALLGNKFSLVTNLEPAESQLATALQNVRIGRINAEQKMAFAQQLAEMLEGGMSLQAAFDLIIRESPPGPFRTLALELTARLRSGVPLSEALAEYPDIFDRFFVGLVRSGEASGSLPLMLTRLSRYMERTENLKRQVRAALVYPTLVICFAVILVTIVMVFGVPRLASFYRDLGAQLPVITRVFLSFCTFMANFVWVWVPALIVGLVLFARWTRTDQGSGLIEKVALKSPLSTLIRNVVTAKFTRTLGTLYGSGVALNEALALVASSVGSRSLEKALLSAREDIQDGQELAVALKRASILGPMVIGMIAAGQESGALDRTLERLADLYESKVEAGLHSLLSIIEPVLIIFVGMMIAFIILVLGLPFLNLASLL